MTEKSLPIKENLLARIGTNWSDLQAGLDRLTIEQMTEIRDAQGWNVKDHIVHLAAWERSIVFFLQRRPRYAGLGVEKALYRGDSVDAVNAAIHERNKDIPLADVRAEFQRVHRKFVDLLQSMTDADLQKPFSEFQPEEEITADNRPAHQVIDDNTAGHYEEHQPWLDALVRKT